MDKHFNATRSTNGIAAKAKAAAIEANGRLCCCQTDDWAAEAKVAQQHGGTIDVYYYGRDNYRACWKFPDDTIWITDGAKTRYLAVTTN